MQLTSNSITVGHKKVLISDDPKFLQILDLKKIIFKSSLLENLCNPFIPLLNDSLQPAQTQAVRSLTLHVPLKTDIAGTSQKNCMQVLVSI